MKYYLAPDLALHSASYSVPVCPYIIAPRKTDPQENCPNDKSHTIYFFSKDQKSIVAPSCFPSLWFKLVLDFDFCIRKNFINTVRLKLVKKEEQVKNKLSME